MEMMRNIKRGLLFVLLLTSATVALAAGETVNSGKYLGVFQTTGLPSSGYESSFNARIGTVKYSEDRGLNLQERGNVIPTAGRIGSVPYLSYTTPLAQSVILTRATNLQLVAVNGTFIADLKNFQRQTSAVDVSFTYRQRIEVKGNPVPKFLTWRLILDSLGKVRYTSPKLVSATPTYVKIVYSPLKLEAGLPSTWAYPNKGAYTYQLIDKDYKPVTGLMSVNTNGAYDEPEPAPVPGPQPAGCYVEAGDTEATCDPDFAVNCLGNKTYNAGCPAFKDGIALMDELGADAVFIDYNRKIQPLYKGTCESGAAYDENEGTCADGSDPVEVAQLVINVKKRELIQSSCLPTATFNNDIDFGYKLQYQLDQYAYDLEAGLTKIGTQSVISLSPTQNYKPTIGLNPIPSNISELIIDPTSSPAALIKIVDFASPSDIIGMAPVSRTFQETVSRDYNDAYPTTGVNGGAETQYLWLNMTCDAGMITIKYEGGEPAVPHRAGTKFAKFVVGTPSNDYTALNYGAVKRVHQDYSSSFCYNGNDRITLCASPQWDGMPGKDEIVAPSPPPRGVAYCPAGSSITHAYQPYTVTAGTGSCGMACYGSTVTQQSSTLYCKPPFSYKACAATAVGPGGSAWSPNILSLKSQTATACVYGRNSYPFTTLTIQKTVASCPAGFTNTGTTCSRPPEYYIPLN